MKVTCIFSLFLHDTRIKWPVRNEQFVHDLENYPHRYDGT